MEKSINTVITMIFSIFVLVIIFPHFANSVDAIYPESWGARGDGTTNDTKALQSAVDAGEKTKTPVVLSNKTYLIDRVMVSTSISGSGTLKINPKNTFVYNCVMLNGNDITVSDIKIDGSSVSGGVYFHKGDRNSLVNCTISNTKRFGVCDDGRDDSRIVGNTIRNVQSDGYYADGIYTKSTTRCQIKNNIISQINGRIGIVSEGIINGKKSRDVVISGNKVEDCLNSRGTEYNAGIWVENTISGTISNNTIRNCNEFGIMIGLVNQNKDNGKIIVENNEISLADIGIAVAELNCALDITVTHNTLRNIETGLYFCGARDCNFTHNSIRGIVNAEKLSGVMKRMKKTTDAVIYFDSGYKGYPYSSRNVRVDFLDADRPTKSPVFSDIYSTLSEGNTQGSLTMEHIGTDQEPRNFVSTCDRTIWEKFTVRNSRLKMLKTDNCNFAKKLEWI